MRRHDEARWCPTFDSDRQLAAPHVFERIVTAQTLPMLSCFEVFAPLHRWRGALGDASTYDPRGRAERILTYDTPIPALREQDWIGPLERALGYVPCLHPEDHYGRHFVDLEAVVQHPIALDPNAMMRRGSDLSRWPRWSEERAQHAPQGATRR